MAVVLGSPVEALDAFCGEEDAELLVVGSTRAYRTGGCSKTAFRATSHERVGVPSSSCRRTPQIVFSRPGGSVVQRSADRRVHRLSACGAGGRASLRGWARAGACALRSRRSGRDASQRPGRWSKVIVVGERGGALRGALLGSVSGALAAAAPVPVLVSRPPRAMLWPARSRRVRRWCRACRDFRGGPHRRTVQGRPGWTEMPNVISSAATPGAR